ncbi:Allantoate amidohydrolase [compost metagenome]
MVSGGQAIRWLDVTVEGMAAHAGTTPMPLRKDALYGTARMIQAVEQLAADFAPEGLTTVGELSIAKSSRNTIPGLLQFTVDLRHHRDEAIEAMERELTLKLQAIASQRGLQVRIERHWVSPATPFDADCVAAVQQAVDGLGYAQQSIVSGAGHDAILLARYCPTAMVFIPCVGGLSHNEAEDVLPEDARQGVDVLLNAALARAGQVEQGDA